MLNKEIEYDLMRTELIIKMKTIAVLAVVGIALPMKLELCWSQFQLQGMNFLPLYTRKEIKR